MTQAEINGLKKGKQTILLDNTQFINVKHVDLPTALVLTWIHEEHKLIINKATDKEYLEDHQPIDLEKQDTLILNHTHPGHERVYKIEISKDEKRAKFVELHDKSDYGLTIKIFDNQ